MYQKAKSLNSLVTHKAVKQFLNNQETTQVFKPTNIKIFHPFHANAYKPFQSIQIDLLDMSNEPGQNRGNKWVFITRDAFTRYVFAFKQISKNETKCTNSLRQLLQSIKLTCDA